MSKIKYHLTKTALKLRTIKQLSRNVMVLWLLMASTFSTFAQSPITITTTSIDQTIANTIQGHLNNGDDVLVSSTGSITINNGVSIVKSAGTDQLRTRRSQRTDLYQLLDVNTKKVAIKNFLLDVYTLSMVDFFPLNKNHINSNS